MKKIAIPFPDPNLSDPIQWWQYNNTVTQGWFAHFILIIIFIVSYAALDKKYPEVALAGSLFLSLVMAMLLWFMELIPLYDIYIGLILFVIVIIANLWRKGY